MENLSNNVIIHKKEDGIQYLQFKKLLQYPNIQHAYGIKPANYKTLGTKITDKMYAESINNYTKLCKALNMGESSVIKPEQQHTNNIDIVNDKMEINIENKYKNTDGLLTNVPQIMLASTNADCIILLLYDPVKNVIGSIHSGWKGTVQKIAKVAIEKMEKQYDCNAQNIICCICPSIRKCHFEVEQPVKNIFEQTFSYTNKINDIIQYKGKKENTNGEVTDKWVIDTILINKILLKDCGLLPENIIDSGICSVCNSEQIHSFRVDGKQNYGLNSAIIGIK